VPGEDRMRSFPDQDFFHPAFAIVTLNRQEAILFFTGENDFLTFAKAGDNF
jgi:hypothetical protein